MVIPAEFESATLGFGNQYSIQLSYGIIKDLGLGWDCVIYPRFAGITQVSKIIILSILTALVTLLASEAVSSFFDRSSKTSNSLKYFDQSRTYPLRKSPSSSISIRINLKTSGTNLGLASLRGKVWHLVEKTC